MKEAEAEATEGAAAKEETSLPKVRGSLLLLMTWAFSDLLVVLCVGVQRREPGGGRRRRQRRGLLQRKRPPCKR